jgi:hypothetical protein
MPHIGQPGFGAKVISKNVGHRGRRAAAAFVVVVVVVVVNGILYVYASVALAEPHGTFLMPAAAVTCWNPRMSRPTISSAFESFRENLDEHYDRRERLVKVHHPVSGIYVDIFLALPVLIGKPRRVVGLEESHLPPSTNSERDIRR